MHHTIEVVPTISTSAYTANDQVGGLQTLTGAGPGELRHAVLESVTVVDKAGQSAALTIFLFDSQPTIASSDNAAIDISDAEIAKCIGIVSIAAGDYASTASNSVGTKLLSPGLALKPSASATLYAVVKTTGTPTYGSTSDLRIKYNFRWD